MTRMALNTRVDADGVLRLAVPVGIAEADREVQVTVEALAPKKTLNQAEYAGWVESLAGTWQGEFERPPQGELQKRDPFG